MGAEILELLIKEYYTKYYRYTLGLPDWEKRVERRLQEEQHFVEPAVQKIEAWLNYDFTGKRVLVVGAGTGGEVVVLHRRGADVYGIEPDEKAYEIVCLKTKQLGLKDDKVLKHGAEDIPFPDDYFDFVYCYTVLEHVQDIERALDEMVRVSNPRGYVFIQTPDYRFPYEGHYKVLLLPFAPAWLQKLYLLLRGRPTAFFSSLNLITAKKLRRFLSTRSVVTMRCFEPPTVPWYHHRGRKKAAMAFISQIFRISKDQNVFLKKLPAGAQKSA